MQDPTGGDHIPPARVGSIGVHVGSIGVCVGSVRLLSYQHDGIGNVKLLVFGLDQGKAQREWVRILMENTLTDAVTIS